jgi:hypothetical protein
VPALKAFYVYICSIDIKEIWVKHLPILPSQAAGNSVSGAIANIMAAHTVPEQKTNKNISFGINHRYQ